MVQAATFQPATIQAAVAGRSKGRLGALAGVLVLATALTGCAAGQRAQTANEFSVVDGASANLGSLAIRDAGVSSPKTAVGYAAGGTATLSMTLANAGDGSDTLVSVSTPNATSVRVSGPASSTALVLPPNGSVVVGTGSTSSITLSGLKYRLVPSELVPVTLTFKVAGPITVQLPVKLVPNQTGGETIDIAPTSAAD